jgi:hypothetical protein
MERKNSGMARRSLRKTKNFLLLLLFLIIPFAGMFHPKIRGREDRDEKEIGDGL